MKRFSSLIYKSRSHYFSSSSPSSSSSREAAISMEVLSIVNSVDPMETALEQVVPFLSPSIITSVLQEQQRNPSLCFRFFVWAANRKQFRSWESHNLLIDMLVSANSVDMFDAYWKVIEEIKRFGNRIPSDAFAVLIDGYWKMNDAEKAVESFGKMKDFDCEPNLFTYNLILHVLVNKGMVLLALAVYNMMLKLNSHLNCSTYSILINGLCKSEKTSDALQLFDEMTKKGIVPTKVTYTVVLSGLCQAKRMDDAYRLFNNMRSSHCTPDFITYNTLVNGVCKLGRMDEAFVLLKAFKKDGYSLDLNGYSCLIDGLFRARMYKEAHSMFEKMIEAGITPDVVLYTIMIRGLCDDGRVQDAFELLRTMSSNGLVPDTRAYNTLIKGFCDKGLLDEARSLKLEISEVNQFADTCTYTILISGMCKHGLVGEAQNIFDEMEKLGCIPSVATFNALIDGLCKSGELNKAHHLFYRMEIGRNPSLFLRLTQGSDRVVDGGSLQTLVTKMVESGLTLKAYKLLTQLADTAILPNITTYNILINGLCKSGKIEGALKLLKELQLKGKSPDSVTYGTLINGLQSVGRENDAFMLLEEMVKNGCAPSAAIYRCLMKWSCRRKKTFAAFGLWLKFLSGMPKREEKTMKLVEEQLSKGEVERPVRSLLDMDMKLGDFDSAPYTIWLIGLCQARKTVEAVTLFDILKEYDINVTPPSCVMLIDTLCKQRKPKLAIEVFVYALEKGFVLKPRICNNLLKNFLRSPNGEEHAFEVLKKMESCGYDLESYLDDDIRFLLNSCWNNFN
ncbi:hypothetical protein OSB04_022955 [Centaurea solstitialis]|uniref:Pentatricopeptide repeat-containing protein n=1 Tax=Centaurea solstitialis TaxID=347529 RepID=A0AA38T2Y1_9ASTR|nr:hypothetical protein OSB04_022955 [Centaurea solstitialis]